VSALQGLKNKGSSKKTAKECSEEWGNEHRRATHEDLKRVLSTYSEAELAAAFVVVEPGRHRFRTLR
jgi:hypothetical protein